MVGVGGAKGDPCGSPSMRHRHLSNTLASAEAMEETRTLQANQGTYVPSQTQRTRAILLVS